MCCRQEGGVPDGSGQRTSACVLGRVCVWDPGTQMRLRVHTSAAVRGQNMAAGPVGRAGGCTTLNACEFAAAFAVCRKVCVCLCY